MLAVGVGAAALYLFRDQIFPSGPKKPKIAAPTSSKSSANGHGNPRDFIAKMKAGVSVTLRAVYWPLWCCCACPSCSAGARRRLCRTSDSLLFSAGARFGFQRNALIIGTWGLTRHVLLLRVAFALPPYVKQRAAGITACLQLQDCLY